MRAPCPRSIRSSPFAFGAWPHGGRSRIAGFGRYGELTITAMSGLSSWLARFPDTGYSSNDCYQAR